MITGRLDHLHLGDLLQWIRLGNLGGRLTIADQGWERRFDFVGGRIVYASSLVPDERAATWLAAEGLLPAQRVRRLLGASLLRRTLFTEQLTSEEGVSIGDLRRSLTRLAERITARILRGGAVRFSFDPAVAVDDSLGLSLDLEPHQLLLEAARQSDEQDASLAPAEDEILPFSGEPFERFFWELVREGITDREPVDGERVAALHQMVRDIVATLAQWLASSPGLVPLPSPQVAELSQQLQGDSEAIALDGLPHAAWNEMVLACAVRSPELTRPRTLAELEADAAELDLWLEMTGSERWRRPHAGRLDGLTRDVVSLWGRVAAAAARRLKVEPGAAALAVHLLAVPTDLVLWVLATLPVPHGQLRLALLRRLPRRLATGLALLADFPPELHALVANRDPTRLGVCLELARQELPSAAAWPTTLPEGATPADAGLSKSALRRAEAAARAAVDKPSDGRLG